MILIIILLALIAVLFAVLLINTAIKTTKAKKLAGHPPVGTEEELKHYGEVFSQMLRCKTVSVKGSYDDTEFAKLRTVVEEQFPNLHQKAERMSFSDDSWLYKLPGKDPSRNIMLMSHHDVVDVDDKWTREPFGGEIIDGKVFGRGAADTKGSLCAILFAMEELLAEGYEPEVNVYIGSSHNEELGGDGVTSVRDWFQKNGIRLEVILDEGGAIVDPPLGNMSCEKCSMVAVHEKGRCRVVCKAPWESSHVSLTGYKNNPVERMAAFIHEVSYKNIFIRDLSAPVHDMFDRLGPYCSFPMNVLFCNLWLFSGIIKKVLPSINATAGGVVGTTCAFQTLKGSTNDQLCTATAMLRYINEEDLQKDLQAFKDVAKKYGIEVEVEYQEYYAPADMNSAAYAYAMDCLAEIFPAYPAAPYILPAGTDAWKLTPVCDCVLRFAPTHMSSSQLASIHAPDENLDISAVYEAAVYYKHFVTNYK